MMDDAFTRHRNIFFFVVAAALVGAVAYGLTHQPSRVVLSISPPKQTLTPSTTATASPVRCHVVGAVHAPGIYTLPPGACINDVLHVAGGPTTDADLESVNLAAEIQDHQQVIIPRLSRMIDLTAPATKHKTVDGLVNINDADSGVLQTLPGIGPVLADRIIEYRLRHGPFTSVDELIEVKGIGEMTLEKLRAAVTVGP
jgi:competence protein ComEA